MDIHQARAVAADPTMWPRPVVELALAAMVREVDRQEAHAAEAVRQKMLEAM